ncbi:unnamed protein product [Danaus chrysippus]|uniref:(African queen) hypothetical protein n=1 Tax=Danaus chrysippus TaxID=151541 RepID=A0A8J2QY61_9NEOP|nr:unnamed protein product [Danaus chrysippus]
MLICRRHFNIELRNRGCSLQKLIVYYVGYVVKKRYLYSCRELGFIFVRDTAEHTISACPHWTRQRAALRAAIGLDCGRHLRRGGDGCEGGRRARQREGGARNLKTKTEATTYGHQHPWS